MNSFGKSSAESGAAVHHVVPLKDRNHKTRAANESSVSLLSFHSM